MRLAQSEPHALSSQQVTPSSPKPLREWLVASTAGLVGAQLIVGVAEATAYQPVAAAAYASETALRGSALGALAAAFHYWASAALLLVTMALLLEMLCNEGYREPRRWYGAVACAIVAFSFQMTGNLLPMDRHGVQTAVVEAGIAGGAPVLGRSLSQFMLSGSTFSDSTLALWWSAHAYILPICAVIATLLILRRKTAAIWAYIAAPLAVVVVSLLLHAPLGAAATNLDFGQYNAQVSWYMWPLHAMLSAFGRLSYRLSWVGPIGVPSVITLGLLLLPWLGKRLTPTAVRGVALFAAAAFVVLGAVFGGPVASLTGNRDPAAVTIVSSVRPKSTDSGVIALVAKGRQLFNSVGCTDCHGKDGAKGDSGPDLRQAYRLHPDPAWYVRLIKNPRTVNPSATMQGFPNLPEAQLTALATFLSEPP